MKVVDLFESIASSTWQRIHWGNFYKISQGEETITDLNLLELARANCPEVKVIKTAKNKEKYQGTDWEWWIGNKRLGWLRYAVQAKKINLNTSRYDVIGHKVNGILQIDILEKYAQVNKAIPLYCFYNYLDDSSRFSDYWHCREAYNADQYGCTVAPLNHVRTAISVHGGRNFKFIHGPDCAKPWRCLVHCPSILQVYQNRPVSNTSWNFENVTVYPTLPLELSAACETGYLQRFSPNIYSQDLEIYPKRILIANYEGDNA